MVGNGRALSTGYGYAFGDQYGCPIGLPAEDDSLMTGLDQSMLSGSVLS